MPQPAGAPSVSRRTLETGVAWSTPVVAFAASAPAWAASQLCAGPNLWDARFAYLSTCTSTNCTVELNICNVATCGNYTMPSGVNYTPSLTNNGAVADTMSKSTGSGYTIQSASPGAPLNGQGGTLSSGGTWTYSLQTTQALAPGACIQFAFTNVNNATSYTFTANLGTTDGDPRNSTNCATTWTTSTTTSSVYYC